MVTAWRPDRVAEPVDPRPRASRRVRRRPLATVRVGIRARCDRPPRRVHRLGRECGRVARLRPVGDGPGTASAGASSSSKGPASTRTRPSHSDWSTTAATCATTRDGGLHGRAELLRGGMSNGVVDYTIGSISLSAFRTLPLVATVLGVNGAFRATDTALPFYQKVYLGGPMSLRGVDFGSLVGDEAWRASVELRRPLLLLPLREGRTIGVGVHAFHDRGTVVGARRRPRRSASPLQLRAGLALQLQHAELPLRVGPYRRRRGRLRVRGHLHVLTTQGGEP